MKTVHEKSDVVPLVAEVFREMGYEGASMNYITRRTGIGKGSLYHFFPGGKEEMARDVLAHVDAWFTSNVFEPLETGDPRESIAGMWDAVDEYFCSGQRICLVGAFALDDTRDKFADAIRGYFTRWVEAVAGALMRAGVDEGKAWRRAEGMVGGIQGTLVLARAMQDASVFARLADRFRGEIFE